MLKIENLSKSYVKDNMVLKNVNLNIDNGTLFAFIGPNGSGKTTLIKSIVGIHDFDSGEIFINDKSIKNNAEACKEIIGYVPDNPDIYEFMSGTEYLNFIADICKIDAKTRKERIEDLAKKFELENDLNTKISQYSHGMKQKLVLISVFMRDVKLLVFDEPFVGLDPKASFILKELMKKFCKNGGAIFFSTHVLDVAEKLCNEVAIIKNGSIVACGEMDKIKGDKSLEDIFLGLYDYE